MPRLITGIRSHTNVKEEVEKKVSGGRSERIRQSYEPVLSDGAGGPGKLIEKSEGPYTPSTKDGSAKRELVHRKLLPPRRYHPCI